MTLGPERTDLDRTADALASEQPTRQLSLAGAGDQCVNCGSPLASDQRYCVTCGERRGKPRFTVAGSPEPPVDAVPARSAPAPRRPRTSSAFNLIAGVATLLLAMGVGVLIGHNSANNTVRSAATPATQVITVGGGGAAVSTPSGSGSGARTKSQGAKSKHGAKAAAAKAPPAVVIQKAAAAAAKVTGGSAKVAAPTATTGSSCTAGTAGCQNGKLTGNYFGQ